MRILFVAMQQSIHTARWISQLKAANWDIHLYPSIDENENEIHEDIDEVTLHRSMLSPLKIKGNNSYKEPALSVFYRRCIRKMVGKNFRQYRVQRLNKVITKIKPDIIHSLEFQAAGYLTLAAKKNHTRGTFPTWIATNWGSDIYLFGRLSKHEPLIREVLNNCDYYSCESQRDIRLAREYGFTGSILPVVPNTGGFDFPHVHALRHPGPVSARRLIMLKGYQGWAGRAFTGLRALERCADLLQNYEVAIFSAFEDVRIAAELFAKSTGVKTRIIPFSTPHSDILKLHGQARISIGLSISDGISTSLLEAMAMGSFPIQSYTAAADEWIVHGKTGMIVHPEDSDNVEQAIRQALTDDDLVNQAASKNYQEVYKRLKAEELSKQVVEIYQDVYDKKL